MANSRILRHKMARRALLLTSAAAFGLTVTPAAHAQTSGTATPDFALNTAQDAPTVSLNIAQVGPVIAADAPGIKVPTPDELINQPQIVVEGPGLGYSTAPGQPGSIYDNAVDVTGVGQFYRADGFVCSGTLINPRTVIFAAHCVNDVDTADWGAATGGIPAAFSFKASAVGGLIDWINAGYNTVASSYVYNVNQIVWNPESTARSEDLGFLQGDVALATLDTPASNVPTWALLFSPLPAPGTIDSSAGTGYHVTVNGYGVTGYGNGPLASGVDFRRRAAENMIGILGSLSDRDNALFGTLLGFYNTPDTTYLQNLYQLDFDDPTRQNPYDFNIFRDDAQNPEGITAGGDSGGPLILDQTFAQQVVIGVLSGGSRYYGNQAFSTYGTSSFYQPLYLFWDWIAANSSYRYTTAKAGDGQWTDPNHWVTALDPNFMVIVDGQLVNGLPTTPGAGAFGTDTATKFGQVCDGSSYCVDLTTGEVVQYDSWGNVTQGGNQNTIGSTVSNGLTYVGGLTADNTAQGGAGAVSQAQQQGLPAGTLQNGLPGGSGYVPNNQDPDPVAGVRAYYFDVTLGANGKTTLSNADIVVDKLTILGTGTTLNVASTGTLYSLIDINQVAGVVNVDGAIGTNGDYTLLSGLVSGKGSIWTPYFTSIGGMIAPGSDTAVGTLTFHGNAILASATTTYIKLGASGTSDRIAAQATFVDQQGVPYDGIVDLGGTLVFGGVSSGLVRDGNHYTIVTAQGGVSGHFDQVLPISAILKPVLTYTAYNVQVDVKAGLYADVVDHAAPVQTAYAQLLDQNRVQYSKYADLYGALDLYDATSIRNTLNGLAPRAQNAVGEMGIAATGALSTFFRNRLNTVSGGDTGGTLAMNGQPLQLAALAINAQPGAAPVMSDAGNGMVVKDDALPGGLSVYLSGGYIEGDGAGLPIATPNGRNNFDGYFIAGGLEGAVGDSATIGFGLGYANLDGKTVVGSDSAKGKLYQGTLYAVANLGGVKLDAQASAGAYETDTARSTSLAGTAYRLTANDRAFTFGAELGVGKVLQKGTVAFVPRASLRYNLIDFGKTAEKGGGPALQYDLGKFESVEGRAGFSVSGKVGMVKPYLSANYVHDFKKRAGAFGANFVGGTGPDAIFGLAGTDQDWAELSGGFTITASKKVDASFSAESSAFRSDVMSQTYRASVTIRF